MALAELKHSENVPGEFFVDTTCIDCDLCRQIAPECFADAGDQSIVFRQPETPEGRFRSLQALVTCPTASIGTENKQELKEVVDSYPEKILDNVYFCGFAAESSYGAASYLIQTGEGNMLIDSPRFAMPLVKKIEKMGGISHIFLTHIDDVADHKQWSSHFNAQRIMHKGDALRLHPKPEIIIEGNDEVKFSPAITIIPTPGHTRGHSVLLFNEVLFSGDHLWWSDAYHSLNASRSVCWYSWSSQTESVEKLLRYEFSAVLPGHGRRCFAPEKKMKEYLRECLQRMRS